MRKIFHYINTMYPLAYNALWSGLALFASSIGIFALSLHRDILAGESDIIYRYPAMLEDILFPLLLLVPLIVIVDLNERKKNS